MPGPRDNSDLELRLKTLQTGVWPTLLACACTLGYVLATHDRPHREVLAALVGAAMVSALVVHLLPVEPLVRRWPEPFFLSWSASFVSFIAGACLADGGTASPLSAMFFLPLAFSALSYPTRSLLAVGALNLVVYGLVFLLGARHPPEAAMFASALITVTWICAWQTRNHDRRRAELSEVSRTDGLTGALNRRGFEERVAAELAAARRTGTEVGFVLLDLDDFKVVNDTRGHQAGDDVLRRVGAALADALRGADAVGRLGGDEFAVLLPGSDAGAALVRLAAGLAGTASASGGASTFPRDGATFADLYRVADARLYERKRAAPAPAPAP